MNIMRKLLLIITVAVISLGITHSVYAQKGYVFQSPGVHANPKESAEFEQPDGNMLTIVMHGDAVVNWATTTDGYTLLINKDNGFEYAITDSNKDLIPSGVLAKNKIDRTDKDRNILSKITPGLHYSDKQIEMKKQSHMFYSQKSGPSKAFPTTGTQDLLMILANFNNTSTTFSQTNFNNYMNQVNYNGTGSFRDYYLEVSYGQLTVNTTVTIWVTLPNTHDYYGPQANWGEFAYEAVVAADNQAAINYANFDNDGDGEVEGIAIIHQGPGQEATGSTNDIWSHSWNLTSAGYSYAQRTFDGVQVNAYTTQPETNASGTAMSTIGVMCHEFGHNLGAPDYYDTDYGTGGQYDGTGLWDMMASGSYNGTPSGAQPAHHNVFTKWYYYGWLTPVELTTDQIVTMDNVENNQVAYYYTTTTTNEYFMLENRQQTGFDVGLPGHGLIIYHVDQDYIDAHDGSNDINAGSHQGLYPKASNGTINSSGCPFPAGGDTQFDDTSNPNSLSWAGANTNKPLLNIAENSGIIQFCYISCVAPCTPPTTQASNFGSSAIGDNQMDISWNRGNGTSVLVLAKEGSAVNADPISGTNYTDNATFGSGDEIGTGNYVVYDGTGTSVTVTGLTAGTTYHYAVYEYFTADDCYNISELTGNATTTGTAPCTPCYSWGNTDWATSTTLVNFNTINNASGKPTDGSGNAYSDYTAQSTDVAIGNSYDLTVNVNTDGNYTVASMVWIDWNQDCDFDDAGEEYDLGTANNTPDGPTLNSPLSITVPATALTGNTVMRVSSQYNAAPTSCQTDFDGEVEDYTVNVVSGVCTYPTTQASNFSSTPAETTMDISWTSGNGDAVIVVAHEAGAVNQDPIDGTTYTANAAFGSGTQIGTGNYVVYDGTGTSVNVTGLTANTTYHFAVYEYSSSGNCYLTPGLTGNDLTLPAQPSAIVGSTTPCQGSSQTYSVTDEGVTYTWSVPGDWSIDAGQGTNSINVTVGTNNGNVAVTPSNASGDGTARTKAVTVNPLPAASGNITGTATVCQGDNTVAYGVGAIANATSYTWAYSGTGATINGTTNNITIDFGATATSGNLTVFGTNACGDGTTSANYAITVNPLPTAPTSVSASPNPIIAGNNTVLSYSGGSGDTFTWFTGSCGGTAVGTGQDLSVSPASTTTYYGGWSNGCGNSACQSVTVTVNSPSFTWDGSSDSDWQTSSNWGSGVVPSSTDNVTIPTGMPNYPVIDDGATTAECNNITIENNASLTIAVNGQMTVSGAITNNAGNSGLVINSDATGTGSLIHSTAGGVDATVNTYLAGAPRQWHMVGSPINNAPISVFPSTNNLYFYDETIDDYWTGTSYDSPESGWTDFTSGNMVNSKGYLFNYYEHTLTYTGQLNDNTTTASIPVSYTDNGGTAANGSDYNEFDGWNLVANPYSAAIDWEDAGINHAAANLDNGVYFYDGTQYASWVNGASTNGGNSIYSGRTRFLCEGQCKWWC